MDMEGEPQRRPVRNVVAVGGQGGRSPAHVAVLAQGQRRTVAPARSHDCGPVATQKHISSRTRSRMRATDSGTSVDRQIQPTRSTGGGLAAATAATHSRITATAVCGIAAAVTAAAVGAADDPSDPTVAFVTDAVAAFCRCRRDRRRGNQGPHNFRPCRRHHSNNSSSSNRSDYLPPSTPPPLLCGMKDPGGRELPVW